ncbi:CYFA0S09e01838g1_1 [Cyberlindnera fabianii]|uniref:CYFA0S09e01838g1_1 n=1 Tax=Cyberlindnera fabianii TaxID=36022 RepID=A0A061B5Q6_CYBFA|nr:Protein SFK1 [Cyberlindnera fabianii]CDR42355.1 CYFA0S09e01838g1_1 [Cyberlindnera fabianii]
MFGIKNLYFLIPIIGMIPWTGMLITMLICWGVQGHPIYAFIGRKQSPVYISHIGATNLQPLFISASGWQGLFYLLTILTEYLLRKQGKLQYWFKKSERNALFTAVVLGGIGQLGVLLCSCFNIKKFRRAHSVFLGIFIVGVFFSLVAILVQYYLMGKHYQKIHVSHKYWNKFMVSFWLKLLWTVVAAALACAFEGVSSDSLSGRFEWTLAFWYTFLWFIFAWDLFPAAKNHHKNQPYIHDWSKYGYYLYEKNFGSSDGNEKRASSPVLSQERQDTLVDHNGEQGAIPTNREFNDEELEQYPVTSDRETYPIPHGQNVPVYNRVE